MDQRGGIAGQPREGLPGALSEICLDGRGEVAVRPEAGRTSEKKCPASSLQGVAHHLKAFGGTSSRCRCQIALHRISPADRSSIAVLLILIRRAISRVYGLKRQRGRGCYLRGITPGAPLHDRRGLRPLSARRSSHQVERIRRASRTRKWTGTQEPLRPASQRRRSCCTARRDLGPDIRLATVRLPFTRSSRRKSLRPAGFEPATYGLGNNPGSLATSSTPATCDNHEKVLASCLALLTRTSPDLAKVVEHWDALPEPVRAGIVAMVQAAQK